MLATSYLHRCRNKFKQNKKEEEEEEEEKERVDARQATGKMLARLSRSRISTRVEFRNRSGI
jgi:hypothetical protein